MDRSLRKRTMASQVHVASNPVSVSSSIQQLINTSPVPERAERYIAEFSARHAGIAAPFFADPEKSRWLVTIFGFSHFLSEELLRYPEWLLSITNFDRVLQVADYRQRLLAFAEELGVSAP